jgi:transaldolase
MLQAVAAAQAGARLISPFPGRVKDYVMSKTGQQEWQPSEDPGVVEVTRMYNYFKKYGHDTVIIKITIINMLMPVQQVVLHM